MVRVDGHVGRGPLSNPRDVLHLLDAREITVLCVLQNHVQPSDVARYTRRFKCKIEASFERVS
jgi:hypothetical protein